MTVQAHHLLCEWGIHWLPKSSSHLLLPLTPQDIYIELSTVNHALQEKRAAGGIGVVLLLFSKRKEKMDSGYCPLLMSHHIPKAPMGRKLSQGANPSWSLLGNLWGCLAIILALAEHKSMQISFPSSSSKPHMASRPCQIYFCLLFPFFSDGS